MGGYMSFEWDLEIQEQHGDDMGGNIENDIRDGMGMISGMTLGDNVRDDKGITWAWHQGQHHEWHQQQHGDDINNNSA